MSNKFLNIITMGTALALAVACGFVGHYAIKTQKELNEAQQEIADLKYLSTTVLLPCPFCGSEDVEIQDPDFSWDGYEIYCNECTSKLQDFNENLTKAELVRRWNQLPGREQDKDKAE